jgi:hypothetical protein
VVELADILVLETSAFGHESSTLSSATNRFAGVGELAYPLDSRSRACGFDARRRHQHLAMKKPTDLREISPHRRALNRLRIHQEEIHWL